MTLAEALREDQPARSQVLDGNLAGVFLVDRRQVIELHAVVQLHAEEAVHRQLAARIGEADDHAIDLALANDRRDLGNRADDTRIDERRSDQLRIGVDEAHQLDAELLAAIEQLLRQRHRGAARADDQQALRGTDSEREPLERETPSGDQDDHERRGDHEHAAADDELRNPVVEHRQDQRRAAERLNQPDDEIAAIGQRAQVVEVAVVQRHLQHTPRSGSRATAGCRWSTRRPRYPGRSGATAASVTANTISSCSISTSVAVRNVSRPRKSFFTAASLW